MKIESPFPQEMLNDVWDWLQEYPDANLDDTGPKGRGDFVCAMLRRRRQGEQTWCFWHGDQPCGIVAFLPLTERVGTLHGVCFSQGHLPRAEKLSAVRSVLCNVFAQGYVKIQASYFSSNHKIAAFLKDLQFREEGLLRRQTTQHGVPVDVQQVALFKEGY